MNHSTQSDQGHKLLKYGILLFLLGLLTGFVLPAMQNPRMGLSSHLEALMNGMFLVLLGIIWPKLLLSEGMLKWAYILAIFGTYTNWITTLLAGIWGAGADMMPIAAGGFYGVAWQEVLIKFGLISLSVAMVIVSGMSFWGLRSGASNS